MTTSLFEPIGTWDATRAEGLQRLHSFAPKAGKAYASRRNYDFGPDQHVSVSCLSPYLRHRLITEREVVDHVLTQHSLIAAEKFVQEVFWRSYFKGWLEQHPSVWESYTRDRDERLGETGVDYDAAVKGTTGIDCFDHWARELVETGYLHNHARMWFASIWIFTLRLPWQLGADFFLQHLLDGDPASNTCSWRWVGGLHTRGKTYLARPENIVRYTEGRFHPSGLASSAPPLDEQEEHPRVPLPSVSGVPAGDFVLLRTEDDLLADQPEWSKDASAEAGLDSVSYRSPNPIGELAASFARNAADSQTTAMLKVDEIADWADGRLVVSGHVPVGPLRDALQANTVKTHTMLRDWDRLCWPHAKAGFFGLKKRIPRILEDIEASDQTMQLL